MVVVKGRYTGQNVVLEAPVPSDIPPNTPVTVVFSDGEDGESVLSRVARLAVKGNLPRDYAEQHEHYTKGTPRR
jgi:hypothetical protein